MQKPKCREKKSYNFSKNDLNSLASTYLLLFAREVNVTFLCIVVAIVVVARCNLIFRNCSKTRTKSEIRMNKMKTKK